MMTDSGSILSMVPGEQEVRTGEPEFTGRICVIGSELKEDALAELFEV